MTIIWEHYRACRVCFAGLGKPCVELSGGVAFESSPVEVDADRPHGGRQLRAGYGRG